MKREQIYKEINFYYETDLEISHYVPISKLKEYLSEAESRGANYIGISGDERDGMVTDISFAAVSVRDETDEEYNTRVAQVKSFLDLNEQNILKFEQAEYERLKAKFENK